MAATQHTTDDAGRMHGRERAGQMWDEAKQSAKSAIDQQKQSTVSGLDDVAGALRDASQRRRDSGDTTVARLTESAADGLDRLSGTLRNKDLATLLHDVDGFAHRQPAAFFGLALVAGFVAVRFIKAGQR